MLDITVSQAPGRVPVTVLRPHGSLDASNFQALITRAQEVYQAGVRDILLDLSDVPYTSSSGLVAIHSLAVLLRGETPPDLEAGWAAFRAIDRDRDRGYQPHLKLLNPQPQVEKVLETTGFKRFLEIYTDLETAVAAF